MKVSILGGVCACLIGCAGTAGDGDSQAPATGEMADFPAAAVQSEATSSKYAEATNLTAAAARIDANDVSAFRSVLEEEASESVAVRSTFDPNRAHQLEAFRGRLEVQR